MRDGRHVGGRGGGRGGNERGKEGGMEEVFVAISRDHLCIYSCNN